MAVKDNQMRHMETTVRPRHSFPGPTRESQLQFVGTYLNVDHAYIATTHSRRLYIANEKYNNHVYIYYITVVISLRLYNNW